MRTRLDRRFGHRRIGFINGGVTYNYSVLRRQGFQRAADALGLPLDAELLRAGATTTGRGAAEARSLFGLALPPTAIVAATDMCALGVIGAATDLGLRVGKDVSVIGYDGVPEGAFVTPSLTTFAVDSRRAGERLADILLKRILGAAPETLRETAPAHLVARGSDGPPALTPAELRELIDTNANITTDITTGRTK
ncbi:MAG: substrate-binding domain-containing protein, partial [Pseudomonadota bacterium]